MKKLLSLIMMTGLILTNMQLVEAGVKKIKIKNISKLKDGTEVVIPHRVEFNLNSDYVKLDNGKVSVSESVYFQNGRNVTECFTGKTELDIVPLSSQDKPSQISKDCEYESDKPFCEVVFVSVFDEFQKLVYKNREPIVFDDLNFTVDRDDSPGISTKLDDLGKSFGGELNTLYAKPRSESSEDGDIEIKFKKVVCHKSENDSLTPVTNIELIRAFGGSKANNSVKINEPKDDNVNNLTESELLNGTVNKEQTTPTSKSPNKQKSGEPSATE